MSVLGSDDGLVRSTIEGRISRRVGESCKLLDDERFDEWLDLFHRDAIYEIVTDSPELRKPQLWFRADTGRLGILLPGISGHIRNGARTFRTWSPPDVRPAEPGDSGDEIRSETAVSIYSTSLEGVSSLYCLVRYRDRWSLERRDDPMPEAPYLLRQRSVYLETRMMSIGSHAPL